MIPDIPVKCGRSQIKYNSSAAHGIQKLKGKILYITLNLN